MDHDEFLLKLVAILVLGVVLVTAVIGMTFVAVQTDRDLWRSELLTFIGALLVSGIAGFSWLGLRRRRRWHVQVDHTENGHDDT